MNRYYLLTYQAQAPNKGFDIPGRALILTQVDLQRNPRAAIEKLMMIKNLHNHDIYNLQIHELNEEIYKKEREKMK